MEDIQDSSKENPLPSKLQQFFKILVNSFLKEFDWKVVPSMLENKPWIFFSCNPRDTSWCCDQVSVEAIPSLLELLGFYAEDSS